MSDCELWGDCPEGEEQDAGIKDKTDAEWTESFIEHGILHWVEFMEGADTLSGVLAFTIAPIAYALFYNLQAMNYRQGVDEDYYENYETATGEDGNLWELSMNVKRWGTASILGALGLLELLNVFLKLGYLNIMIWSFAGLALLVTDTIAYATGLLGLRKMNTIV